jgi:hypothetical protein
MNLYLKSQISESNSKLSNLGGPLGLTLVTEVELLEAGNKLRSFIDERGVLFSKANKRPLLILAFDEAHGLTDVPETRGWSYTIHGTMSLLV